MTARTLLTTADVAERLGVSPRTVIRLVKRGALEPATKVPHYRGAYLFALAEVERYRRAA